MQFAEYLKHCRESHSLTQEQLVEALYHFDRELFEGLNPPTLSRWEHGLSRTSLRRMAGILAYFQSLDGVALPCIDAENADEAEALICRDRVASIFKPRTMVLDLPLVREAEEESFRVVSVRNHPRARELLKLNVLLHRGSNTPFTQVDRERFERWMESPGNLFYAVSFGDSFLGLLFVLKLRTESFDRVLRFEGKKNDLRDEDFAAVDEPGSLYLLSFFALSTEIATLLFRRFYAALIANQRTIDSVGFVSSFDEAIRLGEELNLSEWGEREDAGRRILAYQASLPEVMRSSSALRVLFPKEECNPDSASRSGPPPRPEA